MTLSESRTPTRGRSHYMVGLQPDIPIRPVAVCLASSLFTDSALNLLCGLLYLALSSLSGLYQLLLGHALLSAPVVVVQVSVSLGELSTSVDEVAGEEKVVFGGDSEGVSHKSTGIDDESTGHLSRDPNKAKLAVSLADKLSRGFIQLRALLCVHDGSQRDTKVGDRTPKVYKKQLVHIFAYQMYRSCRVPEALSASANTTIRNPIDISQKTSKFLHMYSMHQRTAGGIAVMVVGC